MKSQFVLLVALVLIPFAGVAQAGPTSPLYLTQYTPDNGGTTNIVVVQGNSIINTFPEFYGNPFELPIAVYGDIRTTGYSQSPSFQGGQYTLSGTPTGTRYVLPSSISDARDSTSDGTHNYLVDFETGTVYQTARDYTNPTALFTLTQGYEAYAGITYDAANNSLWLSGWTNSTVADYSLTGTLLSSFSTGHIKNTALALDPADRTLWLMNDFTDNLEQHSQAGALLSTDPYYFAAGAWSGEFDLAAPATPEPGTLIMFGSGVLGLAGVLRRKINLELFFEPYSRREKETL